VSLVTDYSFFVLFALTILTAAIPAIAQSESNQAKASPALQSPAAKQDLDFPVGTRGLDLLSFNGQSLLHLPQSGELQPSKSVFRAALDFLLPSIPSPVAPANKQTNSVELAYRWGHVYATAQTEVSGQKSEITPSNAI